MKTPESKEFEWAIDALRRDPPPSDSARGRVQERLATTLVDFGGPASITQGEHAAKEGAAQLQRAADSAAGSTPIAAPAAASTGAGVGLATKLFIGLVGVGATLVALSISQTSEPAVLTKSTAPSTAPAASEAPALDRPAKPEPNSLAPISVESLPLLPAGPPTARLDRPAPTPRASLEDEQRLLDSARRALTSGSAAAAMVALDTHRARHPQGVLAQEREALRIKATAALGKHAQASRLLQDFEARYPGSLHAPSVRHSVKAAEPTTRVVKSRDGIDSVPPSQ